MPKLRCRALVPLAAFVLATTFGARALSARCLFPIGEVAAAPPPADLALVSTRAADGVAAHAFALDAPAGRDAMTVVVFHNNRETAADGAALARTLHARGYGVLLVEYRGYGVSRGAPPDEAGLYADAEAALDLLAARGIGPERIVLWGHSLGTGVAAEMARRGRGAALVLLAPYTSIDGLVRDVVPFAPARLLVRDRFDTLAKAAQIHVPSLVVHGDADAIVPFGMGEALARSIGGARLLRVAGGHHGDLLGRDGEAILSAMGALVGPHR